MVTGASRGLGKAMALALASAGARVALVSRDQDKLNQVAAEARTAGGEAEGFCADVGDEPQVLRLEREVIAWFGRVDILINNAGLVVRSPASTLRLPNGPASCTPISPERFSCAARSSRTCRVAVTAGS